MDFDSDALFYNNGNGMESNSKILQVILLVVLSASFAHAEKTKNMLNDSVSTKKSAPTLTSIKSLSTKDTEVREGNFSGTLDMSIENNREELDDSKFDSSMAVWLFLNYRVTEDYKVTAWINTSKSLVDEHKETLNDTKLTLSHTPLELTNSLTLSLSTAATLPTSEKSKRRDDMIGAFEFSSALSYMFSNEKTSFTYLPRAKKYFHEYETSRIAKTNSSFRFYQFLILGHKLTDKVSLGSTLIYTNSWAYTGTRKDSSYMTALEVSYQHNSATEFAIGTSTSGRLEDMENGPNKEIELYSSELSTYYAKVALRF